MGIIVSKFGGSSIADANMFRRVREIILSCPRRQYIVLSAPGRRHAGDEKITDLLNRSHRLFAAGMDGSGPLQEVKSRFSSIIEELNLDICPSEFLSSLEDDVRHSADRAASRGEYLCAKLFAQYADLPFFDASRLIHFDENGRIQREKITQSVRLMARQLHSAVIPGFYGSMPDGTIKTFTRGGSDITGALIAAALNADLYENWTDVDGLMSADPAVISEAQHHPAVSYRQMRMLSRAGAKVLHPYCVEPVCEAGIPTVLKNTFAPDLPGTYISDCVRKACPCLCIEENRTVVPLTSLGEEARNVLQCLSLPLYQSGSGDAFLVLNSSGFASGTPVSIISLFGLPESFYRKAKEIAAPVAYFSTEHSLNFAIRPKSVDIIQHRLHELLFTSEDSRIP